MPCTSKQGPLVLISCLLGHGVGSCICKSLATCLSPRLTGRSSCTILFSSSASTSWMEHTWTRPDVGLDFEHILVLEGHMFPAVVIITASLSRHSITTGETKVTMDHQSSEQRRS